MSDDSMIYYSGPFSKMDIKAKTTMTTCCVDAMCTSALVNAWTWFTQPGILYVCLRMRGRFHCTRASRREGRSDVVA